MVNILKTAEHKYISMERILSASMVITRNTMPVFANKSICKFFKDARLQDQFVNNLHKIYCFCSNKITIYAVAYKI